MNKPIQPPVPDDDFGPLDEHGQQIWSPEEKATIARLQADPAYIRSVEDGLADIEVNGTLSHEQHIAKLDRLRSQWLAERDQ